MENVEDEEVLLIDAEEGIPLIDLDEELERLLLDEAVPVGPALEGALVVPPVGQEDLIRVLEGMVDREVMPPPLVIPAARHPFRFQRSGARDRALLRNPFQLEVPVVPHADPPVGGAEELLGQEEEPMEGVAEVLDLQIILEVAAPELEIVREIPAPEVQVLAEIPGPSRRVRRRSPAHSTLGLRWVAENSRPGPLQKRRHRHRASDLFRATDEGKWTEVCFGCRFGSHIRRNCPDSDLWVKRGPKSRLPLVCRSCGGPWSHHHLCPRRDPPAY